MARMTIRDIARLAGVSVTTVSRALNNAPEINSQTRERVWGSTVGLCCFFKPDSNSTRSPDLTFFQPKRKCSAYPMAAADHCDSNRKYCCLLCGTVSCCG